MTSSLRSESSVTVEYPNTASVSTHIANTLLSCTVGVALKAMATVVDLTPVGGKQLLWVTRVVDPVVGMVMPTPSGLSRQSVRFPKFRAEWLWHHDHHDPALHREAAILYFHGGAFISCGLNTHRRMVSEIGHASDLPVFSVDYRQLPQAHVTETLDDALTAYQHLLDLGFPAERIIVAGDSAGGGLAFRMTVAARDGGLPMPAAIATISPWGDYDSAGREGHPNIQREAYLPALGAHAVPRIGYAIDGVLDPQWSPVNHDFTGLPPVLIQVGSTELLLPDAEALAQRCAEANIPTLLQIWDRAPHVFQVGSDLLPDARAAIAAFGEFNRDIIAAVSQDGPTTSAA